MDLLIDFDAIVDEFFRDTALVNACSTDSVCFNKEDLLGIEFGGSFGCSESCATGSNDDEVI